MGQGLAAGTWPLSAAGNVTQTDRTTGQTAHVGPRHLGTRLQTLSQDPQSLLLTLSVPHGLRMDTLTAPPGQEMGLSPSPVTPGLPSSPAPAPLKYSWPAMTS